jgi:sec-independent protein translocase protein TatC
MAWGLPSLVDMPMGLGEHLGELRRRLVIPLIAIGIVFIAAFAFQGELKQAMVWPLKRAIQIVGADTAISVGLVKDKAQFAGIMEQPLRCLSVLSVAESTTTAVKLSITAAITVTLPILLWQIWGFVCVGLTAKERRLAFLFVPLGVIFFYIGTVAGYVVGLPYFYAWLIEFTAGDQTAVYQLRQAEYIDEFITWTVSFGLVMDIPWLVMVLVRTGMVAPKTIAKARRYIVAVNLILAACITPTSDLFSLMAMFLPMQFLFEIGLFCSRFMVPRKPVAEDSTPVA